MKVIVATSTDQGGQAGDFTWTLEGELVHLPGLECASAEECGCGRGFCGVASHRGTTTAVVAERDLDEADVVVAVAESLAAAGWFDDAETHDAVVAAIEVVGPLLRAAARLEVGTLLRRDGEVLLACPPAASA